MACQSLFRVLGALLVTAVLGASCGGSDSTATTTAETPAQQAAGPKSAPTRIRLALAPDPIWEWLKDSGTVARWEAEHNVRIDASSPFDQFSAFVGGHADVVVINALEVPQFVDQSDREPVIVGRFTSDRSLLAVGRRSQAESLDDLIESRITIDGALGSSLLWGVIADVMHDLEFRVGSPDFDLVVVEPASAADLVMRGDVDACICLPDFSVSDLADGRLRPLYGGKSAAQIYADDVVGSHRALPIADAFVADKQWAAQNHEAVSALLGLWEVGLQTWATSTGDLVQRYPHLFSIQTDAEIDWMTDYMVAHNWMTESVYLTQEDSDIQTRIFARLQDLGLMPDNAREPELDLSHAMGS